MTKQETPKWLQVLAARATGKEVTAEDLDEVRTAARPKGDTWAHRVAGRAVPPQHDDGPTAA
ncbi:hypothetical protein PV350_35405 [Streptomyces sp. PA03-6a]|nr:hypothetical protein [Streptomyces sp. PA03-6a]